MEGGHHQHHQYSTHIDNTGGGGGGDRFPQWSAQETRDFLMIRAELDPNFMETKRNKMLWEVIAGRMREKGYNRSAEQCKCKWKNLVTRYKGCEAMEVESVRQQFPFYNELQAIFGTRMQRMLWIEAEGGGTASGSKKKLSGGQVIINSSDEEDDNEDSDGDKKSNVARKKRKTLVKGSGSSCYNPNNSQMVINGLREILDEFTKQQMQMEMQWMQAYEAREEERRKREMEWRQTMEELENERLMMERRWREREEQRRIREEARAEKKDALVTALLNKLTRADHHL